MKQEKRWSVFENAHKAGLSVGKYRAFLELKAKKPEITPEEVQGLTMRQKEEGQNGEGKRERKRAGKK